jgi:hypothetical protein
MGRQIPIFMNAQDEHDLLAFLRSTAEIVLIESFASSAESLFVDTFAEEFVGHHTYCVWNRAFPWKPEFAQTITGCWYVSNLGTAPVLEIARSNLKEVRIGRLYWARDFSATAPLAYDASAFSKWVDQVWRWVRRNSRRLAVGHEGATYCLPGAAQGLGHTVDRQSE